MSRFLFICLAICLVNGGLKLGAQAGLSSAPERRAEISAATFSFGRFVYERNCQICHGKRGKGDGEWSQGLVPPPRSFRAAHFKYRSTPYGKLPTDDDLRRTIRGGRSGTAMGMFTKLNRRELDALLVYIKSFSSKWKKDEFHAPVVPLPPKPAWFDDQKAREVRDQKGKELFMTACAPCHGSEGDGRGANADTLVDYRGRPIRPASLFVPHLRNGDSAGDLVRVLMTGLNGTPMLSFAETLSSEQIWELVAFIQSRRDPRTIKTPD